jgi:hypothetical protein
VNQKQAKARATLAGTHKGKNPNPDRVAAARRDLILANAEAYIAHVLAATPPLSAEDRLYLTRLLTQVEDGAA